MIKLSKIAFVILIYSLSCYSLCLADQNQEKINKETVMNFYNKAINEKDFTSASIYLGDKYIQHNPKAADGKDGLKSFIAYLKDKAPQYHSEIKKVFADGDFVTLHVHNTPAPGARGNAIVDIFRLEKGKIVEHWDVIQPVPEKSANTNGMF